MLSLQVLSLLLVFAVSVSSFFQSRQAQFKRQQAVWRIECELGIISDPDCPVDGAWTAWGPWSACHGPCDDVGHRRRTRQCTNPPPSDDGLPCNGPEEELETCFITTCTSRDYRKIIEGDLTRIQAFQELEVVPALMERCLQKDCRFEAIETALASDNTWQVSPEMIWNALLCVKHNLGCAVTGEWGSWGPWSACGARCGRGLRWKLRKCDTPPPSNAKLLCPGTPLQAEECEGSQCALEPVEDKMVGDWSAWSEWTPCTEQCGTGVRRRRRYCIEKPSPHPIGTWGTHCFGQYDQLEICEPKKCQLDGGWSGWSIWGLCSQTCGAGKKYRTRSCTRPIPTKEGKDCVGPKTEFGSCYLNPCDTFSHIVAIFNGDSFLQYKFDKRRSALFHFYVRFMTLSPHGTLVRRGSVHNPLVRLSLQKWHICLDATGTSTSCNIPRICSQTAMEAEKWHSALVTVTNEAATLRLNDALVPLKASFLCDPELPNEKIYLLIGERFHGEIQEMTLNFIPLEMIVERDRRIADLGFYPHSTSNLAFDKAGIEEVYLYLNDGQYARLPCFDDQHEWQLELTIKPKRDTGTILFLKDDTNDTWLHVALQNTRLKLKISVKEFRSESVSVSECLPDQWLDVTLSKDRGTNIVEASINGGERLHVLTEDDTTSIKKRFTNESNFLIITEEVYHNYDRNVHRNQKELKTEALSLCNDEFFVGGVPFDISRLLPDEFIPFSGVVASLTVNKNLLDLNAFNLERYEDGKLQVSSRTASISGSYHEMFWGNSNQLNLTCVHARSIRSPHMAHWLYLDIAIKGAVKGKTVRAVDDGKLLKLDASANNELRGFYTCRAHTNKYTRNIVTYGVIGKLKYDFSKPATTGAIAILTTVALVIVTLGWLLLECIHDLRNGFGFFRDPHLTPEQEADAVCKYIDDNVNLIGAAAAKKAKSVARQKAHRLTMASRSNFGAQEPQGLLQIQTVALKEAMFNAEASTPSDLDLGSLPALPEEVSDSAENNKPKELVTHEVYRCEPNYTSSPCHGSLLSPRTKFTSSSETSSPRHICNRLLLAKRIHASRESLWAKRRRKNCFNRNFDVARDLSSNLVTIKSSAFGTTVASSPGQKVLEKFQKLRSDY